MLIIEFAQSLLNKLGTEDERKRKDKDNIRMKLRMVGQLLKQFNSEKPQHVELSNFITGQCFMTVVEAVKDCSLQAESPSMALTLGHYFKKFFLLKINLVLLFIYLFGVLRGFQHCTGHITTGSWNGRGKQYI